MKGFKTIFAILALIGFLGAQELPKTIKVGMGGGWKPFGFIEKGVLKGFEVDTWREIGKRLDVKVEFKTMVFSGLFGALDSGRIDTVANQITIRPERKEKYYFSQPYTFDGIYIIKKKGDKSINGAADLSGKRVGVTLGSNYEKVLRGLPNASKITVQTYNNPAYLYDIVYGRLDACLMDKASSGIIIKEKNLPLEYVKKPLKTVKQGYPFVKSKRSEPILKELDSVLSEMVSDGTFVKISKKWVGTDITKP